VENVVKFPNELERLFEDAHRAVSMTSEGKQKFIEGKLLLSASLAAIRAKFQDNEAFGKSCAEHGLGENVVSRHDRAILIRWAERPDWTRTILEKTERTSVQTIHEKEWLDTLPSPRKSPGNQKPAHSRADKLNAALKHAQVAEAQTGKLPPERELAATAGVSPATANEALQIIRHNRPEEIGRVQFTKAQQDHIDAAMKRRLRELEKDFDERVRLAMLENNKDYRQRLEDRQREANEKEERYERLTNQHRPIFTVEEYKNLLMVAHPDSNPSQDIRNAAFLSLKAKELQLIGRKL
jgi:hypothetical protein